MPAPLVAAPKASRQSNQKVPERFLEGAKWKNSVIPSMIKWAGTQSHIFKIQPERMIDTFEAVCRFYYEDNTISFTVRDPIFATVNLSIYLSFAFSTTFLGVSAPHRPVQKSYRVGCGCNSSRLPGVLPRKAEL